MRTRAGQTSAANQPKKNADWDPLSVRQALLGLVAPPSDDQAADAPQAPSPALRPASRRPPPESTGLVDVRTMAALVRRTPPRLALIQQPPSPSAPAPVPEPAPPTPGPVPTSPTSARLAFALGALSGALALSLAWLVVG